MIRIHIIRPLCPYCEKRPVIKKSTCGHFLCQWKHHIGLMRKRRKTDQVRPKSRMVL